jgi:hypothetical protein
MKTMYPEIASLDAQYRAAYRRRQDALEAVFLEKRVRVNHHRGSYTGRVIRIGRNCSVIVQNDATGKMTERYPLGFDINGRPEVELLVGGETP